MTKTMKIKELVSELNGFDSESSIKVWIRGADKDYPITDLFIDSINEDGIYIDIDDRNLVDLSKIWHEASEEPKKGTHILMEDDFLHSKEYKSYKIGDSLVNNWDTLKKFYRISRWADITDLLPKGGDK